MDVWLQKKKRHPRLHGALPDRFESHEYLWENTDLYFHVPAIALEVPTYNVTGSTSYSKLRSKQRWAKVQVRRAEFGSDASRGNLIYGVIHYYTLWYTHCNGSSGLEDHHLGLPWNSQTKKTQTQKIPVPALASCLIPGGAHRCKENHVHYGII